ncbi:MAG TPA: GDSL-type esterase/lipase family protein, partial [bacterium]|nr:GDSL-type esterase/lipase family protein [bacterium]
FKPSIKINSVWSAPDLININSAGFRSNYEYTELKDSDVFRIACIGNSITFGYRRKVNETFTTILEEILNNRKIKNYKFEVYNFGVPGYTSHQGLVVLKRYVIKYKPDVVIISFGINDERHVVVPDKEQKIKITILSNIEKYVQKFFTYQLLVRFYYLAAEKQFAKKQLVSRVSIADYKKNLEEMINICNEKNIKVILFTPPYNPIFIGSSFGNNMEEYNNAMKEVVNTNKAILLVDFKNKVFEIFEKEKKNLIWDGVHPDYDGNLLLAELISLKIFDIIRTTDTSATDKNNNLLKSKDKVKK